MEMIKEQSNYLRGKIAAELAEPTDHFSPETANLLKHHGMYQQDDRDRRVQLGDKSPRKEKVYQFMVRTSVPGGRLSSQQLLAHIELAEKHGNGTVRLTSRQDLQLHGLAKADLRGAQADQRSRHDNHGHVRRRESQRRLLPCAVSQ